MYYINILEVTPFSLEIIPRKDSQGTITVNLINEQTNTNNEVTSTLSKQGDYYTFDLSVSEFISNTFYTFTVSDITNGIIYTDRIFASDVESNVYDINKDQYITEQLTNNDYIVI
jgi:hypothetical protein